MFKHLKQSFLLGLMIFTLLGVQAVQESPIHDHSQHVLDCALCHFELNDDSATSGNDSPFYIDLRSAYNKVITPFYTSQHFSQYHSRAPPHFFL